MVSLLVNSYGNNILTDGNLKNINSNIKQLLQALVEPRINLLNSVLSLRNNFNFNEKNGDILSTFHNTSQFKEVLENRGYKFTTIESFIYENVNHIYSCKEIPYYKKDKNIFLNEITLNNNGKEQDFIYFVESNYILFVSTTENKVVFHYHLNEDYKLKDFKIDNNKFVFLIFEHLNKNYFAISHLGKNFIDLNKEEQEFNYEEAYNLIEINNDIESLDYTDYCKYYFLTKDKKVIEYEFDKRYYFEDNNKFYFYTDDSIEDYKEYILGTEQVEFLNIYNYLNFLGLNDFKIDEIFKISTKDLHIFKELMINKFDNTLNGGLNYFNAKEIGKSRQLLSNNEFLTKDYRVYINDEYFTINGNFMYNNYQKGNYKIEITKNKVSLFNEENICLKEHKIPSIEEFYFCNLKFNFKKFEFPPFVYTIKISCNDSYTFVYKEIKNYKLKSLPNFSKVTSMLNSSKVTNVKNRIINGEFDGRQIIFYNYFDHKEKRFKYGHKETFVTANQKISLDESVYYYFENSHLIKDDYIYFRNSGKFYFTNVYLISFELINYKGFITDFWIKNQGQTLYFKNTDENIMLSDNPKDCDYYCKIPYIKDFIMNETTVYTSVELEENDDMELEREYTDDLLITNKFFNKPLFYKFFIDNIDNLNNFALYDDQNNQVYEYISEVFQNGMVIYFDMKKDRKYYYNLGTSKYNYLSPIKSHENIEINHYFDDNGVVTFPARLIKSFCLKGTITQDKVSLFLYNTNKGKVYHLELPSEELNEKFELELEINKIKIDSKNINYNNFVFVEDSSNSLIKGNIITYFKNSREEVVYISNYNHDIDIDNLDYSKIKVNTQYSISDSKLIENQNGSFMISQPLSSELPVMYYDHFKYYEMDIYAHLSITNDEFYNQNFKNPGSFYIDIKNDIQKIAENKNEIFEITRKG